MRPTTLRITLKQPENVFTASREAQLRFQAALYIVRLIKLHATCQQIFQLVGRHLPAGGADYGEFFVGG